MTFTSCQYLFFFFFFFFFLRGGSLINTYQVDQKFEEGETTNSPETHIMHLGVHDNGVAKIWWSRNHKLPQAPINAWGTT